VSVGPAWEGTIAARSALGKGSTFTVTLPRGLVSTGSRAPVPQPRPAAPGGSA
jgi:hypothetical protein